MNVINLKSPQKKKTSEISNDISEPELTVTETIERESVDFAKTEDPNILKVSKIDFQKMQMKIDQLTTENSSLEMGFEFTKKENDELQNNNQGLKKMITELKQSLEQVILKLFGGTFMIQQTNLKKIFCNKVWFEL